ncbi:sterol desaturase family protein [Humisphaera borealis]|uniref:Sterol desaturase family protein n=1 Tax=Humisphaera borealis TaxID=2807512 RepID=A0A7M2WW05_9BACT|nr:sterol desaturase family protein [Humisphaera borealis]QOV89646.1 sterol desaturase family protein [Humisphaera borealis]
MDPINTLISKIKALGRQFIEPGAQFSIFALACAFAVAVGFLYLRQRRRRGRASLAAVLRAVCSRRVFFNPSTYADAGYLLINTLSLGGLIAWAMISTGAVSAWITAGLGNVFATPTATTLPDWLTRAGATILFFLAYEFGYWLDHYLKHRVPFLWEMHRPHHTAEVLTPLTVFRVHPLDSLVFSFVLAITGGVTAGVVNFALGKPVLELTLDGTNVLLVVFFYAYVHLQHSEIWIPFRGWAGRLFMSPAHHQIHHSSDPAHFNMNLGSCLAIWDWVFGTLSIPAKESPRLKFGVDDAEPHPHAPSRLLLTPIARVARALARMVLPTKAREEVVPDSTGVVEQNAN